MSKRDYLTKEERTAHITGVAFLMAKNYGLSSLSRDDIAHAAGAATGSVTYCFGNMSGLKDAVIRKAIECEELRIIAEGIIADNKIALSAPARLRAQALNSLK